MAHIILQHRYKIVTQDSLSEVEEKQVKKMASEGKTIKEIENYLLDQNHIMRGNKEETLKDILVINTELKDLDFSLVIIALDSMFGTLKSN